MIYIAGMSHAINVLRAISESKLSLSNENWSQFISDGKFFELKTKTGYFINDKVKAFLFTPKLNWKKLAEFNQTQDNNLQISGSEEYIKLINSINHENINEKKILISFINGNEHSAISMVQNPRPYDFVIPGKENDNFIKNAQPIEYSSAYKQMELSSLNTIACLVLAKKMLPNIKIIHVMPPPPIGSEERIKKNPEIFKNYFNEYGVTPFSLRFKYYNLYHDVLSKYLFPMDIDILPPPKIAIADDGSLLEKYEYAATHANEEYGKLVAQQISELLR